MSALHLDLERAEKVPERKRFQEPNEGSANGVWKDVTAAGAPTSIDEAYTYDALDRLSKVNRGALAEAAKEAAKGTSLILKKRRFVLSLW